MQEGQYLNAVIKNLKDKFEANDARTLITLIPFTRNLIEYIKNTQDDEYLTLTSCLHIKDNINSINVDYVIKILNNILNSQANFQNDRNIKDMIYDEADNILNDDNLNHILIENKIVLAIATRLKVEKFMIKILPDKNFLDEIDTNQTRELFEKIKDKINKDKKELLQKVLMIAPEHIHINSFMYEPILNTSMENLLNLYGDLK